MLQLKKDVAEEIEATLEHIPHWQRITNNNQHVKKWMQSNESKWVWIKTWAKDHR